MSFLLVCPNCGPREVDEFRYGGELLGGSGSNLPGLQRERWYHRHGCRCWFAAERDVRTNTVVRTDWLANVPVSLPASPEGERDRDQGMPEGDLP